MQTGRSYLRVLMLASAMVLASSDVGLSQESADKATVSARASAISADIDGRVGKASNEDAKKCLKDKKTAVNAAKASAATATDLNTVLGQLNEIASQLDSCTSGPNGSPASGSGGTGSQQVTMAVDADTPDPNGSNPSVIIPPGPQASGPGIIGEGAGPDFGGDGIGSGVDVGVQPPVIPPPPVSPAI